MGAKYPLQIPSDAQLDQKNYNYCAQVGGLIGRAEDGSNCFRKMIYKLDFWLRNEFSYYYSFAEGEFSFIHDLQTWFLITKWIFILLFVCRVNAYVLTGSNGILKIKKLIDIVFIRN